MDLSEDLRMSLLNFNFVMIYIIHKILILIKDQQFILKIIFSNAACLKCIIAFYFFLIFFFITYNDEKSKA